MEAEDLEAWISQHGPLPSKCLVLMRSRITHKTSWLSHHSPHPNKCLVLMRSNISLSPIRRGSWSVIYPWIVEVIIEWKFMEIYWTIIQPQEKWLFDDNMQDSSKLIHFYNQEWVGKVLQIWPTNILGRSKCNWRNPQLPWFWHHWHWLASFFNCHLFMFIKKMHFNLTLVFFWGFMSAFS